MEIEFHRLEGENLGLRVNTKGSQVKIAKMMIEDVLAQITVSTRKGFICC